MAQKVPALTITDSVLAGKVFLVEQLRSRELQARMLKYACPHNHVAEQTWQTSVLMLEAAVKQNSACIVAAAIRLREASVRPEAKGVLTKCILERTAYLKENHPGGWNVDPQTYKAKSHKCDICGGANGDPSNKFLNPDGREYRVWLVRDKHNEIHYFCPFSEDDFPTNFKSGAIFAMYPCLPCAVACLAHVMTVFPESTFGFSGDPGEECGASVLDHAYKLARHGVLNRELMTRRDWNGVGMNLPVPMAYPCPPSAMPQQQASTSPATMR